MFSAFFVEAPWTTARRKVLRRNYNTAAALERGMAAEFDEAKGGKSFENGTSMALAVSSSSRGAGECFIGGKT